MNLRNVWAYFSERFPLINMALFAILFITVYSVAKFFSLGMVRSDGFFIFIGIAACISFFFRLRVFDEVKDYDIDVINHPNRVLQSGKVTLKQLTIISAALTCAEILWSCWAGYQTVLCWVLAVGYSLLMRYEFFISNSLKKSLILYALSHMIIMPFIILWIYSAFIPDFSQVRALLILSGLSLFSGFSFEIARKIHTREEERDTVDSYSKEVGFTPSIVIVLILLLIGTAFQFYLLQLLNANFWPYLAIGALYIFTLSAYILSLVSPKEKFLRIIEKIVSLFMLASYLSIIFVVNF